MALNAEDGGNRRFICVQLPQHTDEDSEAHKAGYATIADISKERIRRAAAKLNEAGNPDNQDRGFRVLKLDQSNFRQWQKLGADATEDQIAEQLELHIEHVNATASPDDLLFEILLKAGHQPTEKISALIIIPAKVECCAW
jgi:adenine-specific DNA-methyltransferase